MLCAGNIGHIDVHQDSGLGGMLSAGTLGVPIGGCSQCQEKWKTPI